ncbi:MAG: hypothetical protein FJ088_03685, partial [Deltaproteobacteria bacterium]|nr:hypothetical protein [Deltaproteobacteria bacterium]
MAAFFALVLLLLSGQEDPLDLLNLQINSRILAGVQKPSIVVNPAVNISGLKITLTRDDGKKVVLAAGGVKAGEVKDLKFDQEEGRHSYSMEAVFKGSGDEPLKIEFEVIVKKPPEIVVSKQTVDLEKKAIEFRFSEPCARAELAVYGEGGKVIENAKAEYGGKQEGGKYRITWSGAGETV